MAKFAQNPRLGRWLVDTDTEGRMPPVFHTDEHEAFWALGALKDCSSSKDGSSQDGGDAGGDKGYVGQNINGQVLMAVREMLRQHYEKAALPRRVRQAPRGLEELSQSFEGYETALKNLGIIGTDNAEEPLTAGALIDKRYRVKEHRVTAGLGSYAGHYSYICYDEMPLVPPLETRVRDLLQQTVSTNLRKKMLRLQQALCSDGVAQSTDKEWAEVDAEV